MNEKLKILLIDDEVELLAILALNFEFLNYECFVATTSLEAESILTSQDIKIVVCDLVMPTIGGFELFTRLKQIIPTLPPFYFCSGLNEFPLSEPYPSGILGFIKKPFPVSELLKNVETFLGVRPSK